MTNEEPEFSTPEQPQSFHQIVQRILQDSDYAQYLRDQLRRVVGAYSKSERNDALRILDAHFRMSPDEMNALGLPSTLNRSGMGDCTETRTTFAMLNFATGANKWPAEAAE